MLRISTGNSWKLARISFKASKPLISDINMPGKSGLDALKEIRASFQELPVLILSMHPEEHYALRVLKSGASGYLSKDSASEELVKAVEKVLSGKKYFSPFVLEQ